MINQPEELINQPIEVQLAVANHPQTPRQVLEILLNSLNTQVVEAASMHVNFAGEISEGWLEMAEAAMKNTHLGQNDRLVAELMRFAPVPEVLIGEWMSGHRLIQGTHNPHMPQRYRVKLLERLALSPIIQERLTAAASADTPRPSLEQLVGDLELPIRIAAQFNLNYPTEMIEMIEHQHEIAEDWNTDPEELAVLADSSWSWIRQAVARNPHTPPEILAKLAQSTEDKIQLAVARNLASPAEVLDLLVSHYYREITEAIAKHPNASDQALIQLLPRHEYCITKRASLPISILAQLTSQNRNYHHRIIQYPHHLGSVLPQLTDCPRKWQDDLAKHSNILVSTLEELAEYSCPWVRLAIFNNPKTPEVLRKQILEYFLNFRLNQYKITDNIDVFDCEVAVEETWKYLAESEYTPAFVLEQLANRLSFAAIKFRNNHLTALALIGNPNTPKEVRDQLQQELIALPKLHGYNPDREIYLALVFNSAIPEDERNEYLQQIILYHHHNQARQNLARHPKTPPDILAQLASTDVMSQVAENPNTPAETLRQLAKQKDNYILQRIAKNLATPPDVLVEIFNQPNIELGNYKFRTYADWSCFAIEYPHMPKLELYRFLLDKEIAEENAKFDEFMAINHFNIASLRAYVFSRGDTHSRLILSRMSDTPVHLLQQLASDSDEKVRAEVSENPNLPLSSLIQLTQDPSIRVRHKLVSYNQREHIPLEILELLKSDEAEEIRVLVAIHRNTTPEILRQLANDPSRNVKNKVASNANTPVEILERLWREEKIFAPNNHNTPAHVLIEVIASTYNSSDLCKIMESSLITFPQTPRTSFPQIPAETLEQLASHRDCVVRSCVAEHPNTPISVLERLADDDYRLTRWHVASNYNTPAHVLEQLLVKWESPDGKYDDELCNRLVQRTDAPTTIFEHFAVTESFNLRQAVARNPSTPLSVLEILTNREVLKNIATRGDWASDDYSISDDYFLQSLAYNPRLTTQMLARLAEDPSPDVRTNLLNNPHITPELLMKLAQDESPKVRQAMASKVNFPVRFLEVLAFDKKPEVRQKLASNPNSSLTILERLAQDNTPCVREAVANNNSTPVALLEQLAQDDNLDVLRAIAHNPHTPAQLRQSLNYRLRTNISPTLKGLNRLPNETDDLSLLLSEYVYSSTPFVRFVSLMHALTPIPSLHQGSQSLLWLERYAVANNPATPVELRQQLAQDSNRIVRAAAKFHLSN